MSLLITGCLGFIGSHLSNQLLNIKNEMVIVGIDNINDSYDINIKLRRLKKLEKHRNFYFLKLDCVENDFENQLNIFITKNSIPKTLNIIHLASLAGVRKSILKPLEYMNNNIGGFINILEYANQNNCQKVIYASSSSVYGKNTKLPFCETDQLNRFNSPYSASKMCNEIYADTYRNLYGLNSIGCRFFTVYGPDGRVDMSPYKFLLAIHNQTELTKYGNGTSCRDYTYIDDIVNGLISILDATTLKYTIYNLGSSNPINLNSFIEMCEEIVGKKAIIKEIENQKGDVPYTYSDNRRALEDLNWESKTKLKDGLKKTYQWLIENDI